MPAYCRRVRIRSSSSRARKWAVNWSGRSNIACGYVWLTTAQQVWGFVKHLGAIISGTSQWRGGENDFDGSLAVVCRPTTEASGHRIASVENRHSYHLRGFQQPSSCAGAGHVFVPVQG